MSLFFKKDGCTELPSLPRHSGAAVILLLPISPQGEFGA